MNQKTKVAYRAGHGQNSKDQGDPGAVYLGDPKTTADDLYEDNITLAAVLALNHTTQEDFETIVPRANDEWVDKVPGNKYLGLEKAVNEASANGCELFLSIHVNSAGNPDAEGAEIIVRSGDPESVALAKDVLEAHRKVLGLKCRGVKVDNSLFEAKRTRGMKFALLELGFLSNAKDRAILQKFMKDKDLRIKWAKAIREVLVKHLGPEVKLGDKGDLVKELQLRLNKFGYHLIPDGDFGKLTMAAVKDFQRGRGLEPNGLVDQSTWDKLK